MVEPRATSGLGLWFANLGTQGNWRVKTGVEEPPQIIAWGLGKWQDEMRTVATMKDNSILSHEDAELIARAVNDLRAADSQPQASERDAL